MPTIIDLCQGEALDVPHLVYTSDLSNLILDQMGKILFLYYFFWSYFLSILSDALQTHVLAPTEFYLEPLSASGRLKIMLILTPVLSRYVIPYFNSSIYREHLRFVLFLRNISSKYLALIYFSSRQYPLSKAAGGSCRSSLQSPLRHDVDPVSRYVFSIFLDISFFSFSF